VEAPLLFDVEHRISGAYGVVRTPSVTLIDDGGHVLRHAAVMDSHGLEAFVLSGALFTDIPTSSSVSQPIARVAAD